MNLVKEQHDIVQNYLYAKDLSEPKSEFLIKKRENGIKHLLDLKAFTKLTNAFQNNSWTHIKLSKAQISKRNDFNVLIDGNSFFNLSVKSKKKPLKKLLR